MKANKMFEVSAQFKPESLDKQTPQSFAVDIGTTGIPSALTKSLTSPMFQLLKSLQ
jgi:hypothetical protein